MDPYNSSYTVGVMSLVAHQYFGGMNSKEERIQRPSFPVGGSPYVAVCHAGGGNNLMWTQLSQVT